MATGSVGSTRKTTNRTMETTSSSGNDTSNRRHRSPNKTQITCDSQSCGALHDEFAGRIAHRGAGHFAYVGRTIEDETADSGEHTGDRCADGTRRRSDPVHERTVI